MSNLFASTIIIDTVPIFNFCAVFRSSVSCVATATARRRQRPWGNARLNFIDPLAVTRALPSSGRVRQLTLNHPLRWTFIKCGGRNPYNPNISVGHSHDIFALLVYERFAKRVIRRLHRVILVSNRTRDHFLTTIFSDSVYVASRKSSFRKSQRDCYCRKWGSTLVLQFFRSHIAWSLRLHRNLNPDPIVWPNIDLNYGLYVTAATSMKEHQHLIICLIIQLSPQSLLSTRYRWHYDL